MKTYCKSLFAAAFALFTASAEAQLSAKQAARADAGLATKRCAPEAWRVCRTASKLHCFDPQATHVRPASSWETSGQLHTRGRAISMRHPLELVLVEEELGHLLVVTSYRHGCVVGRQQQLIRPCPLPHRPLWFRHQEARPRLPVWWRR